MPPSAPRVVITGIAALTPLGSTDALWQGLSTGQSGIRRIQHFDPSALHIQIAGEVDFDASPIDPKERKRMSRASQLALVAAQMAWEDAGWTTQTLDANGDRVSVVLGTAQAGYEIAAATNVRFATEGRQPRRSARGTGPAHGSGGRREPSRRGEPTPLPASG